MVKSMGKLPGPPPGLPDDALHATANAVHSAALRLLRVARTADTGMDLDGPARLGPVRARLRWRRCRSGDWPRWSRSRAPAITKTVAALEAAGLAERLPVRRRPAGGPGPGHRPWPSGSLERGRADRVRVVGPTCSPASATATAAPRPGRPEIIAGRPLGTPIRGTLRRSGGPRRAGRPRPRAPPWPTVHTPSITRAVASGRKSPTLAHISSTAPRVGR